MVAPDALATTLAAGRPPLPDPFTLVIFGASGDLTHRKLIPAVYCLFREGCLPDRFAIVGFARREKSDASFRAELLDAARRFCRLQPVDTDAWERFASRISYHCADLADPAGFAALRTRLCGDDNACAAPGNCLFYTATPPEAFPLIVRNLQSAGLNRAGRGAGGWARMIVEKPFGRDLETARELNRVLLDAFDESQIFRIDHYLGKETVQNLLVLRFANAIFEPLWNAHHVDHVQITVAETLGMEGRGRYFDSAGILRDMVQNHMMHLLCLVAMESPVRLTADAIRDEKVQVLRALRPFPGECAANDVVRAQYVAGEADGAPVPGYREEEGVPEDSTTETFAAFAAYVDNWRWAGVPFYLRAGKRLAARVTEIAIHFKAVPRILFNARPDRPMLPNVLTLRIQPHEGISLRFQVKAPGASAEIHPHQLGFGYAQAFGKEPPEAYERLLLDAALGDATLFTRRDEIEAAWKYVAPIHAACAGCACGRLAVYPAGSWGPPEAEELLRRDGRRWEILRTHS